MADAVGTLLEFLISRYQRAEQQQDELRLRSLELVIASCAVEVRGGLPPVVTGERTFREPPLLTDDVLASISARVTAGTKPPPAVEEKPAARIPDEDELLELGVPPREAPKPLDQPQPQTKFPTAPLPDLEPDPVEALWLRPLSERASASEAKNENEEEEEEEVEDARGEEPPPPATPPAAPPRPVSPPPTPDPAPEGPVRGAWEPPERS